MALINGTNGNDNLNGTSGNDTLRGLGGNDNLFGGFFGNDLLDGGNGNDTATYLGFSNNINASLETNKATFFGGSGTFIGIENLIGGNNQDVLIGNEVSNRIDGSAGGDNISGRGGDDFLIGGAGFDILRGELGNDNLRGGDDTDLLDGGDGADFLAGDKGNDTMIGGNGDDGFQWVDGDGSDLIQGDGGSDNLLFNGSIAQGDNINLSQSGSNIILQRTNLVPVTLTTTGIESFNAINGLGGDDVLNISNIGLASGVRFIQFTGGDGNDRLISNNVSPNINASGGNGNDNLNGGTNNDELFGDRGNDILRGNNGNDTLTGAVMEKGGGQGEIDVLTGDAGRDTFVLGRLGQTSYDDGNGVLDRFEDIFNGNIDIDGLSDFARITDFKIGEDIIQLGGSRDSYVLRTVPNSLQGGAVNADMGIFKKGPAQPLELIAIVQDAPSNLNINDPTQFRVI
ncbi:calcium-binding protein [Microcoleus sp. herbarium19]|uniref:calcium-binding protein n=1 Tax=unclassified Microcoleus TaxID=2642155 RepID=UPI002FD28FB7